MSMWENLSTKERYLFDWKRQQCRGQTNAAVASGALVKLPCWTCGFELVEAHHCDYDQPLFVTWLCRRHHKQVHQETQAIWRAQNPLPKRPKMRLMECPL